MSNARDGSLLLVPVNVSGCTLYIVQPTIPATLPHQTFNFCLVPKYFALMTFWLLLNWTLVVADFTCTCHSLYIYGAPEALVVHLIFWNWHLTLMIRSLLWSIFSWEGQTNPHRPTAKPKLTLTIYNLILVTQHLVVPVAASISWPLSLPAARLIDQKKRKLNRWGSNLRSSQMFPFLQKHFLF